MKAQPWLTAGTAALALFICSSAWAADAPAAPATPKPAITSADKPAASPVADAAAKPATDPAGKPAAKPHAKAVIQIWLNGGPTQTDTFDPKPDAGPEYSGPLTVIPTNAPGMYICELLPLLAKQADKYSLIRSMTHNNDGHETAAYMMETGRVPSDDAVYPSLGALVSYFKGYDHGYKGVIPPYVALTSSLGRFTETGFLASKYKAFATGGSPNQQVFRVEGIFSDIPDQRQKNRRDLLHSLDSLGKAMPGTAAFEQFDDCEKKGDAMIADARKLFDLSQEKPELRDRYGRTHFGQSCLMARRLVEAGVPYVTINFGGWDTHKENFKAMQNLLPTLDKGLATLLQDLSDRGLLDTTVVWCSGEFGRTPKVDNGSEWLGGRHHFGRCFAVLVAGGGFKGGQIVGASDAKGEYVAKRPVYPPDLLGSILELLGIDPDAPMPGARDAKTPIMPLWNNGLDMGRLKEIM